MAHVVYEASLGNFGDPYDFTDPETLGLVVQTATTATFKVSEGNGYTVTGTGFVYSGTTLIAGTISTYTYFGAADTLLMTISDFDHTVGAEGFDLLSVAAIGGVILRGNDLVEGSTVRDFIGGGPGNDTLRGGAGGDELLAMNGRDRMVGGAGRDQFVFRLNTGVDTIADFADNGLASDDVIATRRANYLAMTATQQGNNVLLEFGTKGSLLVLDSTVAEIGRDDFVFHDAVGILG